MNNIMNAETSGTASGAAEEAQAAHEDGASAPSEREYEAKTFGYYRPAKEHQVLPLRETAKILEDF